MKSLPWQYPSPDIFSPAENFKKQHGKKLKTLIAMAEKVCYNIGNIKIRSSWPKDKEKNMVPDKSYSEIVKIIRSARERAFYKVNEELINMYLQIGKYVSENSREAAYGDAYVEGLADFFAQNYPELKGFTRRGLYRMRQFYELYGEDQKVSTPLTQLLGLPEDQKVSPPVTQFLGLSKDQKVSTLLTQLSWTNHLQIMSSCKSAEERYFYMALCAKERYSKRQLARQIDSGYYERFMLSQRLATPAIAESKKSAANVFFDTYTLEFLDVPEMVSEKDLQNSIVRNLKNFILEIGRDFTFIGEEYRLQVGGHDYYVDLLFYHRGLSCLVAFELKIDEFKPEYVGKMNLYLEALDRDVKKPNENPSVGVILCAKKDDEVVEYALSRSLSPTMVSEYKLKLIDKDLLQKKLKEYTELAESGE